MSFRPADPRSQGQERYVDSIKKNQITICTGYAGTGKTYLALSAGMELIRSDKRYRDIVIIRPYMPSNTGERLGSLPGNLNEKVGPYLESIRDNLRKLGMTKEEIRRFVNEHVEFTVLSMCRGRSFSNCVVLVEEAQNVPINGDAMKMLFTRIGQHCKMIMAGDLDQCDIPRDESGLHEAIDVLHDLKGVGIVHMDSYNDVQRSGLVAQILQRYGQV